MRRALVALTAFGLLGLTACQSGTPAGVSSADTAQVTQIEQRLDAIEHDLDADGS